MPVAGRSHILAPYQLVAADQDLRLAIAAWVGNHDNARSGAVDVKPCPCGCCIGEGDKRTGAEEKHDRMAHENTAGSGDDATG